MMKQTNQLHDSLVQRGKDEYNRLYLSTLVSCPSFHVEVHLMGNGMTNFY